jgi:hypothetical protein
MPTPMATSIAAWLGAAAWLPPIIFLIIRLAVKPKVTIVPGKRVEIGYTSYGPIFNLQLAVSAARKEAIIDYVGASIQHEDGSIYEFEWEGMQEIVSQIKNQSGIIQSVERDYSPIALFLNRLGVIERFFRFQISSFLLKIDELARSVRDHGEYLKKTKPDYHEELLNSRQVHDVLEYYKQYFFWKTGHYTVTFSIKSPGKAILTKSRYIFDLKPYEVDNLKKNIPLVQIESANLIKSSIDEFEPVKVNWNWVSTSLKRVEE